MAPERRRENKGSRLRPEPPIDPAEEVQQLRFALAQLASRTRELLPEDDPAISAAFDLLAPRALRPRPDDDLKTRLQMSVAELEPWIGVRGVNALEQAGIWTVDDVLHTTHEDLRRIPNWGPTVTAQLMLALAAIGFVTEPPKGAGDA